MYVCMYVCMFLCNGILTFVGFFYAKTNFVARMALALNSNP